MHGLLRTDGKRPDGIKVVSWREGRCFVRDATVADTTAMSYLQSNIISADSAAEAAATRKTVKYTELSKRCVLMLVAAESHGSYSKTSADFFLSLVIALLQLHQTKKN